MPVRSVLFFLMDPLTPYSYTLSLHDALPIYAVSIADRVFRFEAIETLGCADATVTVPAESCTVTVASAQPSVSRSEEHTSELQSRRDLVCRLLLGKK